MSNGGPSRTTEIQYNVIKYKMFRCENMAQRENYAGQQQIFEADYKYGFQIQIFLAHQVLNT